MSLRLRLLLVVLAVAVPTSIASLVAYRIDRNIQRQVEDLRLESSREFVPAEMVGRALSIEGVWDSNGFFLARRIEELPRERRPKLRGAVDAFDPESRTLRMYGLTIRVPADVDRPVDRPSTDEPLLLAAGQRIEISCRIDPDGNWVARRVKAGDVKSNDKLKGTITGASSADDGGGRLDLQGVEVRSAPGASIMTSRGPLHRLESATQVALTVQECLALGHKLLETRSLRRAAQARGEAEIVRRLKAKTEDIEEEMRDAGQEFSQFLADSRSTAQEELRAAGTLPPVRGARGPGARITTWIEPLEQLCRHFEADIARLIDLAGGDLEVAHKFLSSSLEPRLTRELLPLVHGFELEAEEELSTELGAIAERSSTSGQLALVTNLIGLGLALVLGVVVSRSISRPVRELESAARQIGAGDLGARVQVRTRDELGDLGETFNRMAEELSASTVSIGRLNDVIDSLAGALFLLGPDGAITSANPAAGRLLGFEPGELVGEPFEAVCPGGAGRTALNATATSGVSSGEMVFRRKDGSTVPVSFSAAVLRGAEPSVRGFVCLAEDLSGRKRMEEELRRSLSEKELLLRELHHRVKNNLQIISSLLDLQSREFSDGKALDKFRESQDRIRSMVLIHEQLYGAAELAAVDLQVYLELLVSNLSQSHVDPPGRIALTVESDALRLDLDRALACGLIVNELVTNAIKHAYAPSARGAISITCRATNGLITLRVTDDGRGFVEGPGIERLGIGLVRALARQLQGSFSVGPTGSASEGAWGTAFKIEFRNSTATEAA